MGTMPTQPAANYAPGCGQCAYLETFGDVACVVHASAEEHEWISAWEEAHDGDGYRWRIRSAEPALFDLADIPGEVLGSAK